MIDNNSLGKRLNAVKGEKPIPPPPQNEFFVNNQKVNTTTSSPQIPLKLIPLEFILREFYKSINILGTSLLYGYGLKSIFSTDWKFIGILGVGLILNHFLLILLKLFSK